MSNVIIKSIRKFFTQTTGVVKTTYIGIILVVFSLIVIMAMVFYFNILEIKKVELRDQLLFSAMELDFQLQDIQKNAIRKAPDISGSNRDQVLALNAILQPVVDEISSLYPETGIGYYDMRLDSIIAMGPDFEESKLIPVPRSYPYFKSYQTGKVEFVDSNTSIIWNGLSIIAVTIPYYLNDKIVGYIWANQKTENLYISARNQSLKLFAGSLLLLMIIALIIWKILRRINDAIEYIVQSFLKGDFSTESGLLFKEIRPALIKAKEYSDILIRTESIVRDASEGIICMDLDGRLTYLNEAATKIFGYSGTEIIGQNVFNLFLAGTIDDWKRIIDKIRRGEKISFAEVMSRNKDGQRTYISVQYLPIKDSEGNIVGISMLARDLNEQKKRQQELNLSEERFAKIFHASPVLMSIVRKSDRKYIDVNALYLEKRGMSRGEIIGQVVNSYRLGDYEDLFGLLDKEDSLRNIEIGLPNKDGKIVESMLLSAEMIELGGEECILFASTDITELKRLQGELAELDRLEVVASEAANDAKSLFIANMSHEIRTPMTSIIGMTDLTLNTELTEEQRFCLTIVKSSSKALLRILNDILDYSKIEAGKADLNQGLFDIREMLQGVVDLFQVSAKQKDIYIDYSIDQKIPKKIIGDSIRLKQVLFNLVDNGIKYTNHGKVTISIDIEEQNEGTLILIFIVTDSGIGIPKNKLDKVFERFHRVDDSNTREVGGTGLGLAISQKLVELMGGKIYIESKEGVGTKFYFTAEFKIPEMDSNDDENEI